MSIKSVVTTFCPVFLISAFKRIENSPLGYRLAKGVFWSIAGAVISRGLMLFSTILIARILGKTVYGELGMLQSTIGMFGVFAGFGLGLTATKYVAELRLKDPERAGQIISFSGLVAISTGAFLALVLILFAPWLATHTINAPHLSGVLRIGALILFINALNGVQTGTLSGFEAFRTIAHVNLFVGLLSFPVLVCGAWLGGLTGTVWALSINLAINWLLNHLAVRKEARRYNVPLKLITSSRQWSILWKFSLPAVLSGVLVGPVNWACGALLVNQPNGYAEMGIYNAANQWRMAILFIPGMLGQVILPLLSNLNTESTIQDYRKVLRVNIALNAGLALIIVLPLVFLAQFIMAAYGPDYDQGVNILRILALTAMLMALNNVVGQAIASKGKMWVGFTFNALWAFVILASTALLVLKGYGAFGLACATLTAYILHTAWQITYLRKVLV